ncbi:hypothetical protein PVK06_035114 [Gossypium arboreum]|uniref:Reverse transcriptase domain-containing protein n=1 Tax=Gossypium arboreum TaxID=29729 RepID=A0ABR0NG02_GOSAR|nr:hypothetical protein PVK06_035114 [Gossypium arboreum]
MMPFWVQIHDVSIGLFSESLAVQMGNFLGVFPEYDGSNLGKENRNFMRIRVQIDVRRPLKSKKQILFSGRRSSPGSNQRVTKVLSKQLHESMEHDLEDPTLVGEEGKKRSRVEYDNSNENDDNNKGGLPREEKRMEQFLPETNIREQLDRGVANTSWMALFPEVVVQHLVNSFSNHWPLLIETSKEEVKRRKRAQLNWLQLGDRNTAFFHSHATQMKNKNQIKKLQNDNGEFTKNVREIEDIARVYFENLFKARRTAFNEHIFSGIKRCIFDEDNSKLLAPYEEEEIRGALFEMGSTKAPVEDVFPTLFYQRCWDIIGSDVVSFCLNLLNGKMEVSSINATQIVLIPKIINPSNLTHFRPISLCNVIYKIVAKVIANRFRGVIDKCIDEAQNAFVPRKLITDNALVAYEVLHSMKQKRGGKKGFMAIKLDMSKAYDKVEWNFIQEIMSRIGLMRMAISEGVIKGVKASRSGPRVSHLLFADYCIMF